MKIIISPIFVWMQKADHLVVGDGCTEIISKNIVLPCIASSALVANYRQENRLERIIEQMKAVEGATEEMK